MPEAKFFLIRGKRQSTGIIERIIVALDTVAAESRSNCSAVIPSVAVDSLMTL